MGTNSMQVALGWFPNGEIRKSGEYIRGPKPVEDDVKKEVNDKGSEKLNHKFSRTENCTTVDVSLEMGAFKLKRKVCSYLGWLPDADPSQALAYKKRNHETKSINFLTKIDAFPC